MAVNLINSNDIEVTQTGENIQLKTSTPIITINGNIGQLSSLTTTDKSSLVNAINEVNSSATGVELWRNNTPSSAITTLTINLTNDNYDELDIWFYDHKDYKKLYKQTLLKGHNTILYCIEVNGGFYRRNLTRTNDTKYSLGAGYFGSNTTNNVIIPLLIIGKKTGASFI